MTLIALIVENRWESVLYLGLFIMHYPQTRTVLDGEHTAKMGMPEETSLNGISPFLLNIDLEPGSLVREIHEEIHLLY